MRAPVAQLDRASASGVEGRGFESRRVYQFKHLSARVYDFCGFFVICCKILLKPAHRSRNYGIFTANLRHDFKSFGTRNRTIPSKLILSKILLSDILP